MLNHRFATRSLPTLTCLLACLAAGPALAQEADAEAPALNWTANDPELQWGPCPSFLPPGCAIAVLHGDPAGDNLDVFLRVPGGARLARHWHSSAERMVLIAGELQVTYDGQPTAVLTAGSYAYGPAKRPHEGFCASAEPCILFIAFESPLDAVPLGETDGRQH